MKNLTAWTTGLLMSALPAIGQEFEPEKWIKELASRDAEVRHAAAFSINRCAHECRAAVPALIALYQSGDAADRAEAAPALNQIVQAVQGFASILPGGPPVEECRQILAAVRPMMTVGKDGEEMSETLARMSSVSLIGLCGGAAEVPVLLPLLLDPTVNVRGKAIDSLGQLGPAAVEAVPALEQLVANKEDAYTSSLASLALERIRPAAKAPKKRPARPATPKKN
jgi:HEAT repeat protein